MADTKPKAWVVDIDGTLALLDGRGPFDWHRVGEDKPNLPVITVVRGLVVLGYPVVCVTGRMEQCRVATLEWLLPWLVPAELYMRPDGDYRPDEVVKREIYEWEIAPRYDVEGILDDRDKVVRMWREELGLTCLQVAPGEF